MSIVYREPFPPRRNHLCFCQSNEKFKNCCGNSQIDRKVPYGIHIEYNYLDSSFCDRLLSKFEKLEGEKLAVVDLTETNKDQIIRNYIDGRITDKVLLGQHQFEVNNLIEEVIINRIETSVNTKFEWFEEPQVLRYHPNGVYLNHSDSDNFDETRGLWRKDLDRDYSLLIYLNEDYKGGSLYFPNFDFRLKPKQGMLVYFPSDSRYEHTAEKLLSGTRYAIVSWSSILGNEKIRNLPPEEAIKIRN